MSRSRLISLRATAAGWYSSMAVLRGMQHLRISVLLCLTLGSGITEAQVLTGLFDSSRQFTLDQIDENHLRLVGEVEIVDDEWQLYADQVDVYTDEYRLVATGNVVFSGQGSRVAAERVEFDTQQLTGTFHDASGSVSLAGEVDRSMFGTQEPDMLFYGEMIEKLGPRTYKLTKGGFTSCIQPTPRWEVTASSLTLNLDEYAILRNSIIQVKGVPVFYLPVMYYPIQADGRATGFLMPTYGASTFRGTMLSNAFFWAINRSHDVTAFHDWFSQTGQGTGAEYRYLLGRGSEGYARTYFLNEREFDTSPNVTVPARRSYELRGQARHRISDNWNARGQIDYFSNITVQQTYHTNILQASTRQRSFSGNIAGTYGLYQLSGTYDINETFFDDSQSTAWGAGPRVNFGQGKREIQGTPFYYSFNAEYGKLLRRFTFNPDQPDETTVDSGLDRFDVNPVLQIPFTKWPFLTVDSSIAWRGTYWTERLDGRDQIPEPIGRGFFDLTSQITGPSFVKVWDTPNSGYAERMKHVIEPFVTLRRVTAIDNFDQIVQLEGIDSIRGSVTQLSYGINNRLYAKRNEGGREGVAREILGVQLLQSYYTDALAAQYDRQFRTSFNGTAPTNYSPVSVIVRGTPTPEVGGSMRMEYDAQFKAIRTISAEGTFETGGWFQETAGWSQRRFIEELPGFNDQRRLDHYLNSYTSVRTRNNEVGGVYSFHYDILRERYLTQRVLVYYNAQCCGVSAEFQSFNFEGLGTRAPVPKDRRFNVTFTLAGLGTFANVFGAFGGGGAQ